MMANACIVSARPSRTPRDVRHIARVQSEAMQEAADEAKKRGADAIIVISRDASVTGYTSSGTATVVGNTAFGSGVTMPVQTGHVRVTAIKFL
jgi:uncharacterized protein YbjQ (UPF0145 family)